MIVNILLYSFLDSTLLPVLFFIGGAILLGLLFSGLFYWLDDNGFKLNKFSGQYQKISESKRLVLKVYIGIILLCGLNLVPYYNISNSNIIEYKSIFEQYSYGYYIHKVFFVLPIILGFIGSILILWSEVILNRFIALNFKYNYRFYHIIFGVLLITYFGVLFKNISGIAEFRSNQREVAIKAAHDKIVNDSIRHYRDSVSLIKARADSEALKIVEKITCTEKIAIINFHDWIKLYHPDYRINKIVTVKRGISCTFRISSLGFRPEYKILGEKPLVVEIDLNPDGKYQKYSVHEIINSF